MKLAIDAYYYGDQAKTVGVMFRDWHDKEPERIVVSYSRGIRPYEPGSFYKRELPCIVELLGHVDMDEVEVIIVDGYVWLGEEGKLGLGYHLYDYLQHEKPVIGVAKNAFHDNSDRYVSQVYRGRSVRPLYVTAVGTDLAAAAEHVESMYGEYRFPHLLKLLDQETKRK